jgi:diguanylate cyclase (GGDEF)-like protein/PAS domain S-box-containing protein
MPTPALRRDIGANVRGRRSRAASTPALRLVPPTGEDIDKAPSGFFRTDADGNCHYVNERWCEYAGMTPAQALGRGWVSAIHPDDRALVAEAWQAAVETGADLNLEFRSLRPDGSVVWLAGSAVALQRADGSFDGYVGTINDMTATVAARQQLGDERRFVDRVLDIAGSMVCVLDPVGRILRFNRACEVVTGYTFEEVEGRPFYDFLLPAGEVEAVKLLLGQLREGQPPEASENHWVARDGSLHLISWLDTCFFDDAGALTHIVSTGLDITEERRAETAVRALEPFTTMIAKHGPSQDTAQRLLDALADQMGYRHLALFLTTDSHLRLAAQHGYADLPPTFEPAHGIVGRVFRSGHGELVEDVTTDPDYVVGAIEVANEIVVPLAAEGANLGVLTVSSTADDPLSRVDFRLASTVADRLSVALLLGREQQSLADRARLFGALNEFARAANSLLEEERLAPALLEAADLVIPGDISVLTVLDPETGSYRVRAVRGDVVDGEIVGSEIKPGEGVTGRAIAGRAMVMDTTERRRFPPAIRDQITVDELAMVATPLVREGIVLGALLVGRRPAGAQTFTELETEMLALIGAQAALSIANAHLLAEVHALAIRDALTGLYNRRHFDAALEHIMNRWLRDPTNRRPVAAIMFDLDRFGQFNKEHGHQAGDAVLRTFAGILKTRFRSADLVARYGGEEFVAILEGATRADAVAVAEEIRRALGAKEIAGPDGSRLRATVSAGCAELDADDATREALLKAADVGLFMAKRGGRNQVVAA